MTRRLNVAKLLRIAFIMAIAKSLDMITFDIFKWSTTVERASMTSSEQYVDYPMPQDKNTSHSLLIPRSNNRPGHEGFERGSFVRQTCQARSIGPRNRLQEVFNLPTKRVVFCPVAKIASTFWRRLFYMVYTKDQKYENPLEVSMNTAYGKSKLFQKWIKSPEETDLLFNNSFSFLFVRNPYSRLLSAFTDKLLSPNPLFWNFIGVKAVKAYRKSDHPSPVDGHDVTFAEFVRHVADSQNTGKNIDPHFVSISKICPPCQLKFDFIGKLETFQDDVMFIMDKVGINTSVDSIKNRFRELAVDDAILDIIQYPFSWKKAILKSISWEKALQRIWLKLKIRGIIAMDKKLEITAENVSISANDFIELAREAHKSSDPADLEATKDIAKREAFASVPLDVMKAFRHVFHDDFEYFGYDDSPSYIFDRTEEKIKFRLFNYTHLN